LLLAVKNVPLEPIALSGKHESCADGVDLFIREEWISMKIICQSTNHTLAVRIFGRISTIPRAGNPASYAAVDPNYRLPVVYVFSPLVKILSIRHNPLIGSNNRQLPIRIRC
jgi:hypothetical protein